jgi:hypothetical protein
MKPFVIDNIYSRSEIVTLILINTHRIHLTNEHFIWRKNSGNRLQPSGVVTSGIPSLGNAANFELIFVITSVFKLKAWHFCKHFFFCGTFHQPPAVYVIKASRKAARNKGRTLPLKGE